MSNGKDLMGYDPLEWLKEESSDSAPDAVAEEPYVESSDNASDLATAPPSVENASDHEVNVEDLPADDATTQEGEKTVEEGAAAEPSAETPDDGPVLDLMGSLQIMDVALLKPRLEEILGKHNEITLRAEPDIVVDGAGLQLLLAFVEQARENEVKLQWEEIPPPLLEAIKLLNTEALTLAG